MILSGQGALMCLREVLPLHSCERILTCILIYMHVFLHFYLFIFGSAGSSLLHGLFSICREQGLLSSCHVRAFHCSDFSYGAGALGCISSVVREDELSCPKPCGIFPDWGLNPCCLHGQEDSLPLGHQGSPKRIYCKGRLGIKFHQFSMILPF